MISLPNVTLVCVDTKNYGQAINAIQKTLRQITTARTIFFTDILLDMPEFETIQIPHLYNKSAYSKWMIKELGNQHITTSHILVIQHDGFVLDASCWTDEYLNYDYIGAPWLESDGFNVGNGGFSLRSTRLHENLAHDDQIQGLQPEDSAICRIYRDYLEQNYQIKFAPEELAHKFSYELHEPKDSTFGFHGPFHKPYVEPIVIKRSGAMGDVIGVEPVLKYFYSKDHPVYLDTLPQFMMLFDGHYFPVGNYARFDKNVIKHKYIDLDLAYEVMPAQLHLKSYYQVAGILDGPLENPALSFNINNESRIFAQKYVVLHIDSRETAHRNVHRVNWQRVADYLTDKGYYVIQIGVGQSPDVGIRFNTPNPHYLKWLIAGAEFFIGVDSGPSHIAVALRIRSILFFGSVNPAFIHPDLSYIVPMQSPCPANTPNCWHLTPSTHGQDCTVDPTEPPCTIHTTASVLEAINRMV